MNNKLLATAAFVSIALGAYSAPIFTVLDLNSSLLIQNESSKDSLESDSEILLALNRPKNKKSKKEVEEEDDDEELSEDAEKVLTEDTDDASDDSDDSDDGDGDEAGADTDDGDDDDDGADYTDDGDENSEPSNGFGDIKSQLEDKNSTLPESKSDVHIHKDIPPRTETTKLDPIGSVQEYTTYLYGDEIILKHTLTFYPNGSYNINANYKANYKTNTPNKVVPNTRQQGNLWITEFTFFEGKIKSVFTLTPLGNNRWHIDYKMNIIDHNI